MKPIRTISYERGNSAYLIHVFAPSDKYPMYQVTCNDEEFWSGTRVYGKDAEVNAAIDRLLHLAADDWMEVDW